MKKLQLKWNSYSQSRIVTVKVEQLQPKFGKVTVKMEWFQSKAKVRVKAEQLQKTWNSYSQIGIVTVEVEKLQLNWRSYSQI